MQQCSLQICVLLRVPCEIWSAKSDNREHKLLNNFQSFIQQEQAEKLQQLQLSSVAKLEK